MASTSLAAVYRWAIPLAVGASFAQASIYDVKGGTRAVIFDRLSGVKDQVVNEGTHFLVPWLQKAVVYDVRTKPRNISTTTGSKDLQMVSLTLRVLHRPEVKMLPKIYQVHKSLFKMFLRIFPLPCEGYICRGLDLHHAARGGSKVYHYSNSRPHLSLYTQKSH